MLIFKVLSRLLDYPQAEMLAALDEMAEVVEQAPRLSQLCKRSLQVLLASYHGVDLLDAQESYVALFDRGRFLSLHIFEHVHGESRDRGQAMVNLLQMYQSHGFEMDSRELPDFLPLFLEFLSQLPNEQEAQQLLQDAMPVLGLLGARLTERGSDFAAIFDALVELVGETEDLAVIRQQVAAEGDDETLLNIDAIWEEEAVIFMANSTSCGTQKVGWAEQSKAQQNQNVGLHSIQPNLPVTCNPEAPVTSPIKITPREQFSQLRNQSRHGG